jgi:elongation factor Tu
MQYIKRIRAAIRALSTEEGGRRSPIFTKYTPNFNFEPWRNERLNDGRIFLIDQSECAPGEECTVEVEFLFPDALPPAVTIGTPFNMQEGPRVVGTGTVLEILETVSADT